MSHVVRFYHTKKTTINSLDIDNKNNRLVTGSSDSFIKSITGYNKLILSMLEAKVIDL